MKIHEHYREKIRPKPFIPTAAKRHALNELLSCPWTSDSVLEYPHVHMSCGMHYKDTLPPNDPAEFQLRLHLAGIRVLPKIDGWVKTLFLSIGNPDATGVSYTECSASQVGSGERFGQVIPYNAMPIWIKRVINVPVRCVKNTDQFDETVVVMYTMYFD